jgi:hypothetical protein
LASFRGFGFIHVWLCKFSKSACLFLAKVFVKVKFTFFFSKRFGQPIKVVFFSGQPGANKVNIFCKRFGKL